MKAYAIKNKEGEYWCGNDIFSATIDIRKIYICEDFDFISKVINKLSSEGLLTDCKVVEITIAEGDLEEENRVLKRALELCVNVLQREIDGEPVEETEIKTIYEIGEDYFIGQAKKELEGE